MRKLAMQSGMTSAAMREYVDNFEKRGFIKVESSGPEDQDPKITVNI